MQSIERQQALQAEAASKAEAAYDFALQRYRAGLGNYLVVLNTESQVLVQRRARVDLRGRALDTRAVLLNALGGGWDDSARTPAGDLQSALATDPVAALRAPAAAPAAALLPAAPL